MQPNEYHKLITNNRGEELINRKFLPIICNSKLSDFDKWIKIRQELNYFVYKKKKRWLKTDNKDHQSNTSSTMHVSTQTFDEKPTTSKQMKDFANDYFESDINVKPQKILSSFKDTDRELSKLQEDTPQFVQDRQTKRMFSNIDDIGMISQPSKRRRIQKKINVVDKNGSKIHFIESEVNLRNHNYIAGREKLRRSSRKAEKLSIPDIINSEELDSVNAPKGHKEKSKKYTNRTKPYQVGKNKINWITLS